VPLKAPECLYNQRAGAEIVTMEANNDTTEAEPSLLASFKACARQGWTRRRRSLNARPRQHDWQRHRIRRLRRISLGSDRAFE
jgi:hypothetical protein